MATDTLNREELINTIWRNNGKIGLVARQMGVNTRTIYNYVNKWATVKSALDDSRLQFDETLVDTAEVGLQKCVIDREAWAIKYTLSTKGKGRGYVEKQEIDHNIKAPIKLAQQMIDEIDEIWGDE